MEKIGLNNEKIKTIYPDLWKYLESDDVTDLDYNCGRLWITTVNSIPVPVEDEKLTENYMFNFAIAAGNGVGSNFNPDENSICADTETLRITCIHPSQSVSGVSVCIRKFLPGLRFTWNSAIESGYATKEMLYLLYNCVQARLSMAYCGLPGWGKTEALKFCASTIRKNLKVIPIEDVGEINYPIINPGANCSELKVRRGNYGECLERALRMNPAWIFFGESRGAGQVKYLLESWSNGVPTMTTLHVDDCEKIPDRIINMLETRQDSERIVNQVYADIGMGILIRKRENPHGDVTRYIDQIYFFYRTEEKNHIAKVVENGVLHSERLPLYLQEKIETAIGHKNVFTGPSLETEAADG